jgi:hypothetical protein
LLQGSGEAIRGKLDAFAIANETAAEAAEGDKSK